MLLRDKVALIHGGAGAIGSEIARAFAREGARVHLAGRTRARLESVAAAIRAEGGQAESEALDALDAAAVAAHADALAQRAGGIDILVNAVGFVHVQGTPFASLSADQFMQPIEHYLRCNFLTAQAAARHMMRRRRGVILTLSTPGSRLGGSGYVGFGSACAAIENFTRLIACELGEHGIRALCLRPHAIPQASERGSHAREVFQPMADAAGVSIAAMLEGAATQTPLRRLPTLEQVARTAAFLASDDAGAMTATVANLSCGLALD